MITNVMAAFVIPREGAEALLDMVKKAMCQGCAAGVGAGNPAAVAPDEVFLSLITNDPPVSAALEFADLVPSDDTGGTPVAINAEGPVGVQYCGDSVEGPDTGVDGEWRLVIDQRIFTSAGDASTPTTIFGIALSDVSSRLIGYYRIEGGPAAFAEFDIIKVTGDFVLLPQIPVDLTPP